MEEPFANALSHYSNLLSVCIQAYSKFLEADRELTVAIAKAKINLGAEYATPEVLISTLEHKKNLDTADIAYQSARASIEVAEKELHYLLLKVGHGEHL